MIDIDKLKVMAEAVRDGRDGSDSYYEALHDYGMACSPAAVLELIAEIARLTADNDRLEDRALGMNKSWAEERKLTITLRAERDLLKALSATLHEQLQISNQLLAERDKLLSMFDCPEHGQCVPHAMEQVTALRKARDRLAAENLALRESPGDAL